MAKIVSDDPDRSAQEYPIEGLDLTSRTFSVIGIRDGDPIEEKWRLMPENRRILIVNKFAHSKWDQIWCDFEFANEPA